MWRRSACQTLPKALDISSATSSGSSRPVKSPSNTIRYSCQKICNRPFPNTLKYRDNWWNLARNWKIRFNKTFIEKNQPVCYKVQARCSVEPPLEYNQDQMPLTNQGSLFNHLESYRSIMQSQTSSRRENR